MNKLAIFGIVTLLCSPFATASDKSFDVVVYGGTSGGVIAAVQAGRMGKHVVLIEPTQHLGGMTTGGLGATDMGNQKAIGGVSREFYQRILKYYQDKSAWKYETPEQYAKRERYYQGDALFGFEPHVAEAIYDRMLAEAHVQVVRGERLDLKGGVKMDGPRLVSIRMESGRTFAGRVFIDGGYEGDLMARAGVSCTIGREANSQYDETIDGIQVAHAKSHQFNFPVDPFIKPGDPTSGLVHLIHAGSPGVDGDADKRVEAYNYRICTTDVPENRVPFPKPPGYDERDFELLFRYYEAGLTGIPWGPRGMPNRKTDVNNNGAFSTDFIGMADDYPDAAYTTRAKITVAHGRYDQGLLWTLANHPRIPEKVRKAVGKWGLAKDEFADNGNWPYQLYVREGRRMVGEYVVTQHDTMWQRKCDDPVGLGSYNMDSHNCQRYVDFNGHARNEGDVQVGVAGPYGISYRSLVPKANECTNLLVPVCMSASHIGYGSVRMEPVYMILGQACGTAAGIAVDRNVDVQKVPYPALRERLVADKQLVEWTGRAARRGLAASKLPGIVMDDAQARLTGDWVTSSASAGGGVDGSYKHDANADKGQKSARFELKVPKDGRYEVRFAYTPNPNRATNVPVTIESADGSKTVSVNERQEPPIDKAFVSLGTFAFLASKPAVIIVSNGNTDGFVIIDAVQLLPNKP
jgi:hypothetical protein